MGYLIHFNPNHDPKNGRFTYRPGSTVLPKGTKVNSVSGAYWNSENYKNNGRWMYTYRPDEKWDKKVYEGPFSVYLVRGRGAQWIRRHEYETIADMKMPTRKEREEEFYNLLNDKKFSKTVRKELARMKVALVQQRIGSESERKRFKEFNANNIKSEKDLETAYLIFNHMMENKEAFATTKEYAKRISSKWDAMVDDNNYKKYNQAIDPIIIFRADRFIKDISDPNNPQYLTWDEINKNYDEVEKELAKTGEVIKL